MKKIVRVLVVVVSVCPAALLAGPCTGTNFETPVPGATNTSVEVSDIPTPLAAGLWQEGYLDGYFYRVFANLDGTVKAAKQGSEWHIAIDCDATLGICDRSTDGPVPPAAMTAASTLEACLIPALAADSPEEATASPAAPTPCGRAAFPDLDQIAVVQSLLASLGSDPGPADGIWGPKSEKALRTLTADADLSNALSTLDAMHCAALN